MSKYRVILIDDEMLIRKLVRMKLDVDGLNLEIVGEYSNGQEALEGVKEINPDIVISDICMPEEDGISFGEKCIKAFPNTKVIILTGFDDFDYVRRSLKVGVFDYLMKPVQADELNAAVARAVAQIEKDNEKKKLTNEILDDINSNIPALRSIYLAHVLQDGKWDSNYAEKLARYNVEINDSEDAILQVGMIAIKEVADKSMIGVNIKNEISHFFQNEKYIEVLSDAWGRIVVINNNEKVPLEECFEIIQQIIETKYSYNIEYGVSCGYDGWENIHEAYVEAVDNLGNTHDIKEIDTNGMSVKQSLEKHKMSMHISIEKQSVNNPDKGQVMREIIDYMRSNLGSSDLSQTHISEKFGMSVSSLNRSFKSFTGRTYVDVLSMMRLNKMLELLEDGNMKDRDIGEEIGIPDPHYLSIWFKKMTGVSVTEYRNTIQ
ncbi:MAG: response regulator [Lachnospiraceae bacterium]|nr:response regulator [Lachnospiraceae bacterium]